MIIRSANKPLTFWFSLVSFAVLSCLVNPAIAQVIASEARLENITVTPAVKRYSINLPEPFNLVEVAFQQDEYANLAAIEISFEDGETVVSADEALVEGISMIREPSFYFPGSQFDEGNQISEFGFILNYGEVYMAEIPARPGCDSPCMQPHIGAVVFIISSDYTITKEDFLRD